MEGTLLLQLMPFLLEDVERLFHRELKHEVPNKVVNDNVLLDSAGHSLSNASSTTGAVLGHLGGLAFLSLRLERHEVVQIVVIVEGNRIVLQIGDVR